MEPDQNKSAKRKRMTKFKLKIRTMSYPLSPKSFWLFFGILLPFYFPITNGNSFTKELIKVCLFSFFIWMRACVVCRILLTVILKHKGFISETRGKDLTLKTKIFRNILEKIKQWNKPIFMSFQNCLPRLCVPDLKDTIPRYLKSIRPLIDDENFDRISKEAEEFQNGVGKKLQRKLVFKSWRAESYVSDWWEDFHYLNSRAPLMYGTSICVSDNINSPTSSQSARAGNLIYLMLKFRERIVSQDMDPLYLRNSVPICVHQYSRIFNNTRVPGIAADKMVSFDDSQHIVVLHKGNFYKLKISQDDRMLNAAEFQYQIEEILQSKSASTITEKQLPSLTAWNRTKWAEARNNFFTNGTNKESLNAIESAAFVVALDDEPYIFNMNSSPDEYGNYVKKLLVGNGCNRWYDKSFTLCVGSNGKAGTHNDHTWGEGSTSSDFFQDILVDDYFCYDDQGNLKSKIEVKPPKPVKFSFDLDNEELVNTINEAYKDSQEIVNNVDHKTAIHRDFGKGLMKKCKVSPDAFIQMAFQLAYYRQHQTFGLTYEPAMTRLFRKGRTETIRSCTVESSAWVKSMIDGNFNKQERLELFKRACENHQKLYLEAMYGNGVDRHLFALHVAAQQAKCDINFLNEAISESFIMLTSHIPHSQTPKTNHSKISEFFISAGACMPPGTLKGYSISYFPFNDDLIFFHVSSMKNCPTTDTETLFNGIIRALTDIKNLFE